MSAENWTLYFIVAYGVFYFALLFGVIFFLRWRRKTKWPFKDSDKLLRGPGEGLRRQLTQLDESLLLELAGAILGALLAVPGTAWLARQAGLSPSATIIAILGGCCF